MGTIKNKLQSDLHKKYEELKRQITHAQYVLKETKREEWDIFCYGDRYDFNRRKARHIVEQKLMLSEMHKECRLLKSQLTEANREYNKNK